MKKLICVDNEGVEKKLKLGEEYEGYDEDANGYFVELENEFEWFKKNRFKEVKEKRYIDMLWFLLGLSVILMILEKIIK